MALINHNRQPLLSKELDPANSKLLSSNIDVSTGVIRLLDFPLPTADFQVTRQQHIGFRTGRIRL